MTENDKIKATLDRIEGKLDTILEYYGLHQESIDAYYKGIAESSRESAEAKKKRDAAEGK